MCIINRKLSPERLSILPRLHRQLEIDFRSVLYSFVSSLLWETFLKHISCLQRKLCLDGGTEEIVLPDPPFRASSCI